MELNELQQRLLEKLESISTDDILRAIFSIEGQPSYASVNKIEALRESILGSAEYIAEEVSKKANNTDIVFDALGLPKDNGNAKALDLIRQDTWQKIAEANRKLAEKYNFSDEALKHMSDPFALNETRENSRKVLNERFLEIKDKLESADLSIVPFDLINQPKLNELVKYESKEERSITPYTYETREIPVLDRLNEVYTTKLDEILKLLIDRENKFLKDKETESVSGPLKFYEPEEKTVTLNQKQFSDIINAINLSSETQKKVLEQILDNGKEEILAIKDIKSIGSGGGGFLSGVLGGLFSSIGSRFLKSSFGRFLGKFAKLGTIISGIAVGLGVAAKPLAQIADSIFGTKLGTIVDRLRESTGMDQRKNIDTAKWSLLGFMGASNVLKTGGALLSSKGRRMFRQEGSKSLAKTGSRWSSIAKMMGSKAKQEVAASEKAAAAAAKATNAIKATGAVGEAAAEVGKVGGVLGKIAGSGGMSLIRGAMGSLLRKIPIIGGLVDLGMAWDSFSKGDTTGGIISVLSAATNLLYLLGPEMAVVAIPLQLGLSALDWFLTSQAGGDIKQKQSVIPNFISGLFGGSKKSATEKPVVKPEIKEAAVTPEETKQVASDISLQENNQSIEMETQGDVVNKPRLINPENENNYRMLNPISDTTSPTVRDIASVSQPVFSSMVSLDNQSLEKLSLMLANMPSPASTSSISIGSGGGGSPIVLSSSRDEIYETRRRRKPLHMSETTNPSTY